MKKEEGNENKEVLKDLNKNLANKKLVRDRGTKKMKRKKFQRVLKLSILILLLFLFAIYIILMVFYRNGDFIISLEDNFAKKSGIIIYEDDKAKESRRILKVEKLEFMDNIAEEWINKDVHTEATGSHNGDNYIAYTYFVENQGQDVVNYWTHLIIDDVFKNVDAAIRVKLYRNDEEPKTFAKLARNGGPEPGTEPFYSDDLIFVEPRRAIKPGESDRITIVIWLHGPDPECIDPIIGGEMKMHIEITEEQLKNGGNLDEWAINTKMPKE